MKRERKRKKQPGRESKEKWELLKMGYEPYIREKSRKKCRTTSMDITDLYEKNEDGELVVDENKNPILLPKEEVLKKVA